MNRNNSVPNKRLNRQKDKIMFWDEFDMGGKEAPISASEALKSAIKWHTSKELDVELDAACAVYRASGRLGPQPFRDALMALDRAISQGHDLGLWPNYGHIQRVALLLQFCDKDVTDIKAAVEKTATWVDARLEARRLELMVAERLEKEAAKLRASAEAAAVFAAAASAAEAAKSGAASAAAELQRKFVELDRLQPQTAGQAKRAGFTGSEYRAWLTRTEQS